MTQNRISGCKKNKTIISAFKRRFTNMMVLLKTGFYTGKCQTIYTDDADKKSQFHKCTNLSSLHDNNTHNENTGTASCNSISGSSGISVNMSGSAKVDLSKEETTGETDPLSSAPDYSLKENRVFKGEDKINSPEELLAGMNELINKIADILPLTCDEFNMYIRPVLLRTADFVYTLPASEYYHHSNCCGLLRHSLETAFFASRGLASSCFDLEFPGNIRINREGRLAAAVTVAALLHDIGKPLTDIKVYQRDNYWQPLKEGLHNFLIKRGSGIFSFKYVPMRGKRHELLAPLAAANILTADFVSWMMEAPDLLEHMYSCISGNRSSRFYSIIKNADIMSVKYDLASINLGGIKGGINYIYQSNDKAASSVKSSGSVNPDIKSEDCNDGKINETTEATGVHEACKEADYSGSASAINSDTADTDTDTDSDAYTCTGSYPAESAPIYSSGHIMEVLINLLRNYLMDLTVPCNSAGAPLVFTDDGYYLILNTASFLQITAPLRAAGLSIVAGDVIELYEKLILAGIGNYADGESVIISKAAITPDGTNAMLIQGLRLTKPECLFTGIEVSPWLSLPEIYLRALEELTTTSDNSKTETGTIENSSSSSADETAPVISLKKLVPLSECHTFIEKHANAGSITNKTLWSPEVIAEKYTKLTESFSAELQKNTDSQNNNSSGSATLENHPEAESTTNTGIKTEPDNDALTEEVIHNNESLPEIITGGAENIWEKHRAQDEKPDFKDITEDPPKETSEGKIVEYSVSAARNYHLSTGAKDRSEDKPMDKTGPFTAEDSSGMSIETFSAKYLKTHRLMKEKSLLSGSAEFSLDEVFSGNIRENGSSGESGLLRGEDISADYHPDNDISGLQVFDEEWRSNPLRLKPEVTRLRDAHGRFIKNPQKKTPEAKQLKKSGDISLSTVFAPEGTTEYCPRNVPHTTLLQKKGLSADCIDDNRGNCDFAGESADVSERNKPEDSEGKHHNHNHNTLQPQDHLNMSSVVSVLSAVSDKNRISAGKKQEEVRSSGTEVCSDSLDYGDSEKKCQKSDNNGLKNNFNHPENPAVNHTDNHDNKQHFLSEKELSYDKIVDSVIRNEKHLLFKKILHKNNISATVPQIVDTCSNNGYSNVQLAEGRQLIDVKLKSDISEYLSLKKGLNTDSRIRSLTRGMTEECRRIVADAEESDALTEEEMPVETLLSHRSGEISEAFKGLTLIQMNTLAKRLLKQIKNNRPRSRKKTPK